MTHDPAGRESIHGAGRGWGPRLGEEAGDGAPAGRESIDAYVAAWNAAEPLARRSLLAEAVTDDCVYAGPNARTTGPEELDAAIVEARDYVPGASVVRVGEVEGQGPQCTFRWAVLGPAGGPLMKGTNVVEVAADGRLRRIEVVPGAD